MKNLEKMIEEKENEYQQKRQNLIQTQQMLQKLQNECVNLEGQIQSLKELKEGQDKK